MKKLLFDPGKPGAGRGLGLLILRVTAGASLLAAHGWGKLATFGERAGRFPDPLGVGSEASLALAVFAEVVCAVLLIVGLAGRWSAAILTIFFIVAFFVIHGGDPFGRKELAFVYLAIFATLSFTGPGRYSLDALIRKR